MQDLRYAIRGMRRSPAFTIAAVLTLGFGTGAISTVFTLANTLFFRHLPVEHADRVVVVQATRRHGRAAGWVSYAEYIQFHERTQTLEGLAAHYSTAPLFVSFNNQSSEVNGAVVSANFFPLLGVKPALGRFFGEDEDRVPDRDRVAVISHDLWRKWFAESAGALGASLHINGTTFTVIGVAPRTFPGVTVQPDGIYIPTMMARSGYRWCEDAFHCNVFDMIGRLREGVTVEQARAEMAAVVPAAWAGAKENENSGVTVFAARGVFHPDIERGSEVRFVELLAAVGGVLLLVCCVNLAGLLIARNSARMREFAIRASLGAGRGRLTRQLITEAVLLAVTGGALGIAFSLALTGQLNAMFYSLNVAGKPLSYNFTPELRVILAAVAASIVAGLLVGAIPAAVSLRADAAGNLKRQSSAIASGSRFGRWLVGTQAGAAVALAVVAGLLTTSAQHVLAGSNFEATQVALMRLRPRMLKYSPEKAQRVVRAVMERLQAMPGVESASMVGNGSVLLGRGAQVARPEWLPAQAVEAYFPDIGPRYFETLRIAMLRGREFDARDRVGTVPVAIVNETLARRLWPGGTVIGATVQVNGRAHQVVGLVKDMPIQTRGLPPIPYVYTPFWQNPAQVDASLCVRVKGDPAAMIPALVREVNRVDPDVPIDQAMPLTLQIAGSNSSLRITAAFVSCAAVLAVLLSALGLYGALAFSVSRRTKEIGIRMAIGARSSEVLLMVVREGMMVIVIGIVSGVGLAMAATRLVRHLLHGTAADEVQVYAAAAAVMVAIGLAACWLPARRAAGVEPLIALRED